MRAFLLTAVTSISLFVAGSAAPTQDPPAELTPAELELIRAYIRARDQEVKPHEQAIQEIWKRYERLIRQNLPPEKFPAWKALYGGC